MSIQLTDEAVAKIKEFQAERGLSDGHFFRVQVIGGGCSGYEYRVGFDDFIDEHHDMRMIINGIQVVIDNKSLLFLDGMTIDYVSEMMQQGFKFNNPNATGTCGCGTSFSV